jgi:divalent metal cation (Fe/Co/Zn/Cd) transporter
VIAGGYVIYTGIKVVKEAISGIMDEADYGLLKKVIRILEEHRVANWIDVHNLRIIK